MSKLLKLFSLMCVVSFAGSASAEEINKNLPHVVATTELSDVDNAALIEAPSFQASEPSGKSSSECVEFKKFEPVEKQQEAAQARSMPFTPFTGKVRGQKVRLRLHPELDGYILKELENDTFISVVNEKGDFWAIDPLGDMKVYIFRSFVLDNTVEGNHVNIRLEPSLEAPIVGHMSTGDKVDGKISNTNNKWLEITPPQSVKFYVAKEYIENIGPPSLKLEHETRQAKVEELLESTAFLVKAEFRKNFNEIDVERLSHNYKTIINDFSDFPKCAAHAKNELAALNDLYLQRKIEYLESKTSAQEEVWAHVVQTEEKNENTTDKMKLWEPIEESLYLTWARLNEDKNIPEYYEEQKLNSVVLTGFIEAYKSNVKNKPGDFILKDNDLPLGYIYSTCVNLNDYVGKKITLIASPRPNNHYAFPAYYAHEVQ